MKKILSVLFLASILLAACAGTPAPASTPTEAPTSTPAVPSPSTTATPEVFALQMPEKRGEYNGLATAENSILVINEIGEIYLVSWDRAKNGVRPDQVGGSIKWIVWYNAVDHRYHIAVSPNSASPIRFGAIYVELRGDAILESATAHQFISALEDAALANQVQQVIDDLRAVSYCFEPGKDPSRAFICRNH